MRGELEGAGHRSHHDEWLGFTEVNGCAARCQSGMSLALRTDWSVQISLTIHPFSICVFERFCSRSFSRKCSQKTSKKGFGESGSLRPRFRETQ